MKFVEYIENICQEPLSKYQKAFFEDMEQKLRMAMKYPCRHE